MQDTPDTTNIDKIQPGKLLYVDGPRLTESQSGKDEDKTLHVIVLSRTENEVRAIVLNSGKSSLHRVGDEIKLFLEENGGHHRLAGGLNAPRLTERGGLPLGTEITILIQDGSVHTCREGIETCKKKLQEEIVSLETEVAQKMSRLDGLNNAFARIAE